MYNPIVPEFKSSIYAAYYLLNREMFRLQLWGYQKKSRDSIFLYWRFTDLTNFEGQKHLYEAREQFSFRFFFSQSENYRTVQKISIFGTGVISKENTNIFHHWDYKRERTACSIHLSYFQEAQKKRNYVTVKF